MPDFFIIDDFFFELKLSFLNKLTNLLDVEVLKL